MEARQQWPARGPNARGWGEFLAEVGIPAQTARDLMALAGYVEEVSTTDPSVVENLPTVREVAAALAVAHLPAEDQPYALEAIQAERSLPVSRDADAVVDGMRKLGGLADSMQTYITEVTRLLGRGSVVLSGFGAWSVVTKLELLTTKLREFSVLMRSREGEQNAAIGNTQRVRSQ